MRLFEFWRNRGVHVFRSQKLLNLDVTSRIFLEQALVLTFRVYLKASALSIFEYSNLMGSECAVVGSGDSLNHLTEDQLEKISKGHSIGINDVIFFEELECDSFTIEAWEEVDSKERAVQARAALDSGAHLLVTRPPLRYWKKFRHLRGFAEQILVVGKIGTLAKSEENFSRELSSYLDVRDRIGSNVLFDPGMSVFRFTLLLLLCGAKEITFTGVDLSGTPHFWRAKGLTFLERKDGKGFHGLHPTQRPGRAITATHALKILQSVSRSRFGAEFFNSSPLSLLADFVDDIPLLDKP